MISLKLKTHYTSVMIDGKEVDRVPQHIHTLLEYVTYGIRPVHEICQAVIDSGVVMGWSIIPVEHHSRVIDKTRLVDRYSQEWEMDIVGPKHIIVIAMDSWYNNDTNVIAMSGYIPHTLHNIKDGRIIPIGPERIMRLGYSYRHDEAVVIGLPLRTIYYIKAARGGKKQRKEMLQDFIRLLFRVDQRGFGSSIMRERY